MPGSDGALDTAGGNDDGAGRSTGAMLGGRDELTGGGRPPPPWNDGKPMGLPPDVGFSHDVSFELLFQ